ncbi:MAG: terminase small subunit [Alphaproteobacteria bacterium]|nr:terminase small subunit [Alphaproteobacteria bacterium]
MGEIIDASGTVSTEDVDAMSARAWWTYFFKITPKQRAFVDAYLANGGKGSPAYRSAYGTSANPRMVANEASKLVKHPDIALVIFECQRRASKKLNDRYQVSADTVLGTLARLMSYDVRDIAEWDEHGNLRLKTSDQIDGDAMVAITEISRVSNGNGNRVSVKLADRKSAAVELGRHLGLWKDRTETTFNVTSSLAERLKAARQRLDAHNETLPAGPVGELTYDPDADESK